MEIGEGRSKIFSLGRNFLSSTSIMLFVWECMDMKVFCNINKSLSTILSCEYVRYFYIFDSDSTMKSLKNELYYVGSLFKESDIYKSHMWLM